MYEVFFNFEGKFYSSLKHFNLLKAWLMWTSLINVLKLLKIQLKSSQEVTRRCTSGGSGDSIARWQQTQGRYHQKSKIGTSVAPQKRLIPSNFFYKKKQKNKIKQLKISLVSCFHWTNWSSADPRTQLIHWKHSSSVLNYYVKTEVIKDPWRWAIASKMSLVIDAKWEPCWQGDGKVF